ncbi:hypothetical protein ACFL9S_11090 [Erwinia sp. AnSW2-5]|uniref:hypothetical protein n=1 Tax=Erwinia sp. AnSW2-5 TaxID=3367692 RepID=UPI00385D8B77
MTLIEYIEKHFSGNQAQFARYIKVAPAQITQWINKDFIVVDDVLYSPRRTLKSEGSKITD